MLKKAIALPLVLALSVFAPACGGDDSPAAPTTPAVFAPQPQLFEGKLQGRGDSLFFSFTVSTAGTVSVVLASVTTGTSPGTSVPLVLGLGLGSPLATDCNMTSQVQAAPGLTAQLTASNVAPAIYCVRVFDVGTVTTPINFAVRITHT